MFGSKPPPPPPASFLEDAVQQVKTKMEELTAVIQTKVEDLAVANDLPIEHMWATLGGVLMVSVLFLVMRAGSSKPIVATCELGVAGKPCGSTPSKEITPIRSPSASQCVSQLSNLAAQPSASC